MGRALGQAGRSTCKAHGPTCRGHRSRLNYDRPTLDREELAHLFASATGEDRAILLLLYDVPLRSAEIEKIRPEHLDWKAGTLRAPRVKAGIQGAIGLAPATLAVLQALTAKVRGPIFPTWGPRKVQAMFRRVASAAGLPGGKGREGGKRFVHILRRTRATDLLAAGVELRQVQRRLGHSSWQTTMLYAGISPERSREVDRAAGRALDAILTPAEAMR